MRRRHFRTNQTFRIVEMRFALLREHEELINQRIKFMSDAVAEQYADGFLRWRPSSIPQVRVLTGKHSGKEIIGLPLVRLKRDERKPNCKCNGLPFPHRPGSKGCLIHHEKD